MFGRLGLVGRLVAILLVVVAPLALLGIAVDWAKRAHDTSTGLRLPLPDQTAAIVTALEASKGAGRETILRAVNSDSLSVRIEPRRPDLPDKARRMPAAEWIVKQYLDKLAGRDVEVIQLPIPWRQSVLPGSVSARVQLRIEVAMSSGDYAIIEPQVSGLLRIFGLPDGFWIGLLGTVLGGSAIAAIVRETRPLADLAASLSQFSGEAAPEPVKPSGAPDIRRLVEAFNAMQARIAALVKGRTILLGAISHDLKTYITRLRLRVEALSDETAREKAIGDLDAMTALIDGAVAVARGAADQAQYGRVNVATLLRGEAESRNSPALTLALPPWPVIVSGDEVGLRRVFANLIDNALAYARRCEISITRAGECATILFDDDGPGIPASERTAVLEPFYRLETSRSRATGGSGLGLAIVHQIVEAHGGQIAVAESPMGGARFRLDLPLANGRATALAFVPSMTTQQRR